MAEDENMMVHGKNNVAEENKSNTVENENRMTDNNSYITDDKSNTPENNGNVVEEKRRRIAGKKMAAAERNNKKEKAAERKIKKEKAEKEKKISQQIDKSNELVLACIQEYKTKEETVRYLFTQFLIHPIHTECIWMRLEEQNEEFFEAYNVMLKLCKQINWYNKLLDDTARLFLPDGAPSVSLNCDASVRAANNKAYCTNPSSSIPNAYLSPDRRMIPHPSNSESQRTTISNNSLSHILPSGTRSTEDNLGHSGNQMPHFDMHELFRFDNYCFNDAAAFSETPCHDELRDILRNGGVRGSPSFVDDIAHAAYHSGNRINGIISDNKGHYLEQHGLHQYPSSSANQRNHAGVSTLEQNGLNQFPSSSANQRNNAGVTLEQHGLNQYPSFSASQRNHAGGPCLISALVNSCFGDHRQPESQRIGANGNPAPALPYGNRSIHVDNNSMIHPPHLEGQENNVDNNGMLHRHFHRRF